MLKSLAELGDCNEDLEQAEKCMLPECRKSWLWKFTVPSSKVPWSSEPLTSYLLIPPDKEMAKWIKHFVCKHKDHGLDLQNLHKSLGQAG
jgi:hypothetical protein